MPFFWDGGRSAADFEDEHGEFAERRRLTIEDRQWYVIPESHFLRQAWACFLGIFLIYTATISPYRLVFVQMSIAGKPDASGWDVFDRIVDVFFYVDLVVWFFFTYRSSKDGKEVFETSRIAKKYLKSYFLLNLIACIPPQFFRAIVEVGAADSEHKSELNKVVRLTRLERLSRLLKVLRFLRLARVFECYKHRFHKIWRWVHSFRSIRIVNFAVCLFEIVHLLACGWYLTAFFHDDPQVTWVAGRDILDQGPFDQWMHANYFILTVFSSVGFGDMSASTIGEICYVNFVMTLGAIVQSIVLGEVIHTLLQTDKKDEDSQAQKLLVESYAEHVRLNPVLLSEFMLFFRHNRSVRREIDREGIKNLIQSNTLPRELMELLVDGLFKGRLKDNMFMKACSRYEIRMPVRFPLMLALALNERRFSRKEIVYRAYDYPANIFLVMKGTFAYIAFPSPEGGLADLPAQTLHDFARRETKLPQKSMTRAEMSRKASLNLEETAKMHGSLFPYQLFGKDSYFGDVELMLEKRKRYTGVRSEFDGGKLLVLHENDLLSFVQEYGRFGIAWRTKAKRRHQRTQVLLTRLKSGRSAENYAANAIQTYWRLWQSKHSVGVSVNPRAPRRSETEEYMTETRNSIRFQQAKSDASHVEAWMSGSDVQNVQRVSSVSSMPDLHEPDYHELLGIFSREMHAAIQTVRQDLEFAKPAEYKEARKSLPQIPPVTQRKVETTFQVKDETSILL